MKPGGVPYSPRPEGRGGKGVRWRGFALAELLLYIVIATSLAVSVIRSVKPQKVVENNAAKILIDGLENLMLAHQLSKPSCNDQVYALDVTYKAVAEWCWLFVPDPVNNLYPYPTSPIDTFQADKVYTYYPTRFLSDFWGDQNGWNPRQGNYVTFSGTSVTLNAINGFIQLSVQPSKQQLLANYDLCMDFMDNLIKKVTGKGYYMVMQTPWGQSMFGRNALEHKGMLANIINSYDPTTNSQNSEIARTNRNYCLQSPPDYYNSANRNALVFYLGVRS
ncbi:MAG: hypothetical protein RIT26_1651 [Pseudomonadota bacterium]|jgi:hypothetical protein